MPGDLASVPEASPLREGDDAKVALARSRADAAICRRQYVDLKTYYEAFTAPVNPPVKPPRKTRKKVTPDGR